MTSLTRKQSGFTIIELLIVIVVIGILATLVITTFSGIQRNARNRAREADINSVRSQLEFYYGQQGVYPTLAQVNDATWRTENLRGLEDGALQDPQGEAATLVATPAAGSYAYEVENEAGDACTNEEGNDCVRFTLTATLEDEDAFVRDSLN